MHWFFFISYDGAKFQPKTIRWNIHFIYFCYLWQHFHEGAQFVPEEWCVDFLRKSTLDRFIMPTPCDEVISWQSQSESRICQLSNKKEPTLSRLNWILKPNPTDVYRSSPWRDITWRNKTYSLRQSKSPDTQIQFPQMTIKPKQPATHGWVTLGKWTGVSCSRTLLRAVVEMWAAFNSL